MPASRRQPRSRRSTTSMGRSAVRSRRIASGTSSTRARRAARTRVASIYYNQNAGDPTKWTYVPDLSQPAYIGPDLGERERACHLAGHRAQQDQRLLGRAVALPEVHRDVPRPHGSGAGHARGDRRRIPDPAARETGHLVVAPDEPADAGRRLRRDCTTDGGNPERDPNPTRNLVRVAEQCASGCAANGGIPGLVYRSQDCGNNYGGSYTWRASVCLRHRRAQPEGRLPGQLT